MTSIQQKAAFEDICGLKLGYKMRLYGFAGCESHTISQSLDLCTIFRLVTDRNTIYPSTLYYRAGFVAGLIFSILGAVHLFIGFYVYVTIPRPS